MIRLIEITTSCLHSYCIISQQQSCSNSRIFHGRRSLVTDWDIADLPLSLPSLVHHSCCHMMFFLHILPRYHQLKTLLMSIIEIEKILTPKPCSVSPSLAYPPRIFTVMSSSYPWASITHILLVVQGYSGSRRSMGDMCLFIEDECSAIES